MAASSMIEIRKPEEAPAAFQAAWNAHDMVALGSLFDDDATFVNRFGHYVRGVENVTLTNPRTGEAETLDAH